MPRGPRIDAPGFLHHVMGRGIEKRKIYQDDADRDEFLKKVGSIATQTTTPIYAFALMPNHFHLLIRSGPAGLSNFMQRLLSSYVMYYNRRHKRVGHLFQNRYKSIPCEEEVYFGRLVRYIHLNPLKANLVKDMAQLDEYPWTGHARLIRESPDKWFACDYTLAFFGETKKIARQAYRRFMLIRENPDQEEVLAQGNVSGKDLIPEEGFCNDIRILGSSVFAKDLLQVNGHAGGPEDHDNLLELARDDIIKFCATAGIPLQVLMSSTRSGVVTELRKSLVRNFVRELGLSQAETARLLNISVPAVSYLLKISS